MEPTTTSFHPGEVLLKEFLVPAGLTQASFAQRIGWSKARLARLISGQAMIDEPTAAELATALGTTRTLWLDLQTGFDLERAASATF